MKLSPVGSRLAQPAPRRWAAATPSWTAPQDVVAPAALVGFEVPVIPAQLPFKLLDPGDGSIGYRSAEAATQLRDELQARKIRLFGVRHGKASTGLTEDDPVERVRGRVDSPLLPEGRRQAAQAAAGMYWRLGGDDWLLRAAADPAELPVVYSSPASRAYDTAQAFVSFARQRAEELCRGQALSPEDRDAIVSQLAVRRDPRLGEIDYGVYELCPLADYRQMYPKKQADWLWDFGHRYPQGESRVDVARRLQSFLEDVARDQAGRTVLCYSHMEALGTAQALLGAGHPDARGRLSLKLSELGNAMPLPLVA